MNLLDLIELKKNIKISKIENLSEDQNKLILSLINEKIANETTSLEVANYFIQKGKESNILIRNRHLQHLVYLSFVYHLGLYNKPLAKDPIKAWDFGPVIEKLYNALMSYGNGFVNDLLGEKINANVFSIESISLLDQIWKIFYLDYTEQHSDPIDYLSRSITTIGGVWHDYWFLNKKHYVTINNIDLSQYYNKLINFK